MKHDTSKLLSADTCIGRLSIELEDLLARCMNDQGVCTFLTQIAMLICFAEAILQLNAEGRAPSDHANSFVSVRLMAATLAPFKSHFGVHIIVPGDNPVVEYVPPLSDCEICYIPVVYYVALLLSMASMATLKVRGQQQTT